MRFLPTKIHRASLLLACLFIVKAAHADVYQIVFSGPVVRAPSYPPEIGNLSFTFDTGRLYNDTFDSFQRFECGQNNQDCFVAQTDHGSTAAADGYAIFNRTGSIVFTELPEYTPGFGIEAHVPGPLFTGPDNDPHVLTGTYDHSSFSLNSQYQVFDGTATITDTTPSAVPEPSSFALMGTGILGGLAAVRRRFS